MSDSLRQTTDKEETYEEDFPDMPMKWFGLYRWVLIAVAVLSLVGGALAIYIGITQNQGNRLMLLILLGVGVLGLLLTFTGLLLFKWLKEYRFLAYVINRFMILLVSVFGAALGGVGIAVGIGLKLGFLKTLGLGLGGAVLGLIYPLFNTVYFTDRKQIFTDGEKYGNVKLASIVHIVFHVIVSIAIIVGAFIYVPDDWTFKLDLGIAKEEENPEPTEEEIAAAEAEEAEKQEIRRNFDELSLYLGYKDADSYMSEIERVEAAEYNNVIDLHGMDQKDAYEFISVEYFALSSYEEALMATNPYNNQVITNFQEYQGYVMDAIRDYYKYFN